MSCEINNADIQRFVDNMATVDEVVNSSDLTVTTTGGNTQTTLAGYDTEFQAAISAVGWIVVDSFEAGATLTSRNQALRYASTGELYRWGGTLPKVVSPGSTPASSGGTGAGAWVLVNDNRQVTGLKLLPVAGSFDGDQWQVASFYTGGLGGGGVLVWKPSISKSTHNGVTHYAPEALAAWNGTQAGLATLLNWTGTGSGVWVRTGIDLVTPEMAGAVGDGLINDTAALTAVLSYAGGNNKKISGAGKTYGVSGNITLPSWVWLENIKFKQLSPAASNRRTLLQSGGSFCRMEYVIVDRNGDGSSGSLSDAAGIWIANCPKVKLLNVEVFGNDAGSGIAVIDCDSAEIESPYVHDITAGTVLSPAVTDDTIHGLWVQRGTGVRVTNPRVKNLLNRWSGQSAFNRFSRGIAIGGAKQFCISSPMVDNVDQGIDLTGDENPEFFEVNGGIVSNCYTWGTKCANSVQNGVFTGVIAYRCGQSGFVASAPSSVMPNRTQNITYIGCKSIQTGFGGAWTALTNVAGFRTANTSQYPDYPRSIKYIGCSADGNGGIMEYGFFNDVALGTTDGEQWVEAIHCDVQSATIKNYHGLQTGYAERIRGSAQSIPNDVWTDLNYTSTTDYMGASASVPTTTLNATRSGLYHVSAGVTWEGRSGGTRSIRILVNGAEAVGSAIRDQVPDANERNMAVSLPVPISTAGVAIKVQVKQDTGTPLNISGNSAIRIALISAGFGG